MNCKPWFCLVEFRNCILKSCLKSRLNGYIKNHHVQSKLATCVQYFCIFGRLFIDLGIQCSLVLFDMLLGWLGFMDSNNWSPPQGGDPSMSGLSSPQGLDMSDLSSALALVCTASGVSSARPPALFPTGS